jgi:hypothetical protein
VTRLRQMMLEELQRRNYSKSTTQPSSHQKSTVHGILSNDKQTTWRREVNSNSVTLSVTTL